MLAEGKELPNDIMSMIVKEAGNFISLSFYCCFDLPLKVFYQLTQIGI